MMQIYTGTCGNLAAIACDDDFCGGANFSQVQIAVIQGTQYLIRIGGWSSTSTGMGATGPMILTIGAGSGLPTPNCSASCTTNELEPCGSDTNGGCNSTPA